jgi:YD repeat-containing protein
LFLGGNSFDGPQLGVPGHYLVGVYNSFLGKAKLVKSIETIYASDNTNSSTTTVNYVYDNYLSRLLKETKEAGNNTKYESNYYYAQDLVSPPQFVTDMITLNVVGVPLYTTQSKIVGSTPFFSGANKSEYIYSSGKLRLLRQTKFNATGSNAPTASFTDPNFSLAVQFDSYDNRGNLLQYTTADGVSSSYVWGYNAEYPIAEAKGATVGSIFYTSFEEDGTVGNAKTGNRSFLGTSYAIPVSKQPIGTNLVMSYWYFNGQWLFQPETTYSATITKSGATAYDEIRVYPAGTQMATYTYDPQIGMTSATDANNVTTYYEYDSFNRLKQVADRDKSIVKKLSYNYKN